ncbi:MAG: hypothetical protein V2I35_00030 [Desulfocapsaceae bacterium]|jgi:hypothetical protein|nr:hypothetical protein [Desulfocapsaceae bacterium]
MAVSRTFLPDYGVFKKRCCFIVRICLPGLISFICICLFLFLSIVIIEGYSISEMMQKERDFATYKVLED